MLEDWRFMVEDNPGFYLGWGGLAIGAVFGFIVFRTNFCSMGSISDFVNFGDWRRFRSWLLAGLVAILGVYTLQRYGVMNPGDSIYLTTNFGWLGNIVGGLIFGVGMVLSGGCVSRNLVRAGSGDLRSLMVLIVIGIFGYMTIGGILGPLRQSWFGVGTTDLTAMAMKDQSVGSFLSAFVGLAPDIAGKVALWGIVAVMAAYIFMSKKFLKSPAHLIAGVGIGLCVVAGWMLTGLAQGGFDPVPLTSLTYVQPMGNSLEYLMRFTAFGAPSFAVTTTAGALLGGFLGALSKGELSIQTFANKSDTVRNLVGAAIMGIGGVLALGCTIGQAVTGLSTLALGSFITFACIVLGGVIMMKIMERFA